MSKKYNNVTKSKKTSAEKIEIIKEKLKSNSFKSIYIFGVTCILISIIFSFVTSPKKYSLNVGDISPTSIIATKEVIDEIETETLKDKASKEVLPVYLFHSEITESVLQQLEQVFKEIEMVQEYGKGLSTPKEGETTTPVVKYSFTKDELAYARSLLSTIVYTDYQLTTIMFASDEQLINLKNNTFVAIQNSLNTTIREGYVSEAISYLQQVIGYKVDLNLLQNVVIPILRTVVQPNMLIDQDATLKLQEEARLQVLPVIYKQGDEIISAYERVTMRHVQLLNSLGLLNDSAFDLKVHIGIILLVIVCIVVLALSLKLLQPSIYQNPKEVFILMIILLLSIGFCLSTRWLNPYLSPILLCTMLVTSLLGVKVGISICIPATVLMSVLVASGSSSFGTTLSNLLVINMIGSTVSVYIIKQNAQRSQLFLAGIITAFSNFIVILSLGTMLNSAYGSVLLNAAWTAGGCVLSSIFCIAVASLFETFFSLSTPIKLLELTNPNHPLLRRLLLEASGTYHHSILVANLAENAAEAIDANPLLARAGAYFHDVGKLSNPSYFMENQMGENPHNHITPQRSAAIVTAHTTDGVILGKQARLPKEILEIIAQHHGNTVVAYFYNKAVEEQGEENVDINDFRYKNEIPTSQIAAIIMLADTVEAAVRSLKDPSPERIAIFIKNLVSAKIADGQLDNAPITFKQVTQICEAFCTVLSGVFHERIQYPNQQQNLLTPTEKAEKENKAKVNATAETKPVKSEESV